MIHEMHDLFEQYNRLCKFEENNTPFPECQMILLFLRLLLKGLPVYERDCIIAVAAVRMCTMHPQHRHAYGGWDLRTRL